MSLKTVSAGSLGVLSTDLETPEMTETSVTADLLQSLEILTHGGIDLIGRNMLGNSVLEGALSVEEE